MPSKVNLRYTWGRFYVWVDYFPWGYVWSVPSGQLLNKLSDYQYNDIIADLDNIAASQEEPWVYEFYKLEVYGNDKRPEKQTLIINP